MIPLYSKSLKEFSFGHKTLARKISQENDLSFTGYWRHRLQYSLQNQDFRSWYLGLSQGKIVFSDSEPLSIDGLLAIVERYLPSLRNDKAKYLLGTLKQMLPPVDQQQQLKMLPNLLESCYRLKLAHPKEIERALRLKILQDFDEVLFDSVGHAEFLPDSDLSHQVPIPGFDLKGMLSEARRRKIVWDKVKTIIPSLDTILMANDSAIKQASLTSAQKVHLQKLISHGDSIDTISESLCQDRLEIAKGLAQLVNKGLFSIQPAEKGKRSEILIVDDSPLMLQMFQTLVSSWGYPVRSHSEPTSALEVMLQSNPVAIFLDVNMPEISGFDLLKQIRRQPALAGIPLIVMTAERTLSNNWRAQWSGCRFLSKPLAPEEFPNFKIELRMLLETILG